MYVSMFLALRGGGCLSNFPEKNHYVTLECPLSAKLTFEDNCILSCLLFQLGKIRHS